MKTIQLWPSGKSVTFSGDYPKFSVKDGDAVADASPELARQIQANELAQMYAERDVLCCQSSLVSELINEEFAGFTVDDIENTYRDASDWTVEQCHDYLEDNGGDFPSCDDPWSMNRDELVELLEGSAGIQCHPEVSQEELLQAVLESIDEEHLDGLDEWREAAQECSNDNPQEAYEWWAVSQWLCKELRALGEIVIDNGYGCWWGRGCTGQGMLMDGTLQDVAYRALSR